MSVETIILRFRDLSTKVGETIALHKAKIGEYDYTWWGWWSKAGETIPGNTFRDLMSIIESNGCLEVFLFDTGTMTLYEAKIKDIHWGSVFEDVNSPAWDATPDYYEGRQFKAWYKLTEIDDGTKDEAALRRWSYVEVSEAFETKRSIFEDFDGKQVSSLEELRHQERTIWFVRPFRSDDKIHEILLYDTGKVIPSNFPENIIESRSPRLLWLSDLHFSEEHHAFPLKDDVQQGSRLAEAIRQDLEAQSIREIGGVVVTGDLTWGASNGEFALVRSFLDDTMSWATLTPNKLILCPGNHDIAFSAEPWVKGKSVPIVPAESKKDFEGFYSDLFSVVPNSYLASGRRFLLSGAIVVEVVSLNSSCLRQTDEVFQGHGFVGEQQMRFVAEEMHWPGSYESRRRPFRIVVLHHHVVPVIPAELALYDQQSTLLYDAGLLCNWIVEHKVDLVLHGHMHHTKVVKEMRSLRLTEGNTQWHGFTVASLGSTGVDLEHNLLDRRNVYGLLEFSSDGVGLMVREIHPRAPDRPVGSTIVDLEIPYEKAT